MSEFTQRSAQQGTFLRGSKAAAESTGPGAEMVDNRADAQHLAKMQATIGDAIAQRFSGAGAAQLVAAPAQLSGDDDEAIQNKADPAQLAEMDEVPPQAKADPAQLAEMDEVPPQAKADPAQLAEMDEVPPQAKADPAQLAEMDEVPPQAKADPAQLSGDEDEAIQNKADPAQLAEMDEVPPQAKADPAQLESESKPNKTGIPNNVKTNVEKMSGVQLDDAKVNYNSSKPAQLNALAFAQGKTIEVAPGQEKHVPHETWHLVQQAQGRVAPTKQMKGGTPINDDSSLEQEADVMGARAAQAKTEEVASN